MIKRIKELSYDTINKKFLTRDPSGKKLDVPLGGLSSNVGDTLYVYSSETLAVAPVASSTPTLAIGEGQGVVFLYDGGESMSWDPDEAVVNILKDGLYDGFGQVTWNPAADATPSAMYPYLDDVETEAKVFSPAYPLIAAATSLTGRFLVPLRLSAGDQLKAKVSRAGNDVLTCTYYEFSLIRIG